MWTLTFWLVSKDENMEGKIYQDVSRDIWINEYEIAGNHISQAEDNVTLNEKLSCF